MIVESANWEILISKRAQKSAKDLPIRIRLQLELLVKELESRGPYRNNWSHYGPLKKTPGIPEGCFHCHISNGRPTYVVCWQLQNKQLKIVEIFYVGTHEKAPY